LVGDVRGEAALASLGRGQGRDFRLERRRHLVEGLRPAAELVLTFDREPRFEQSLRKRPGCVTRLRNGPERATGKERADERGDEHQDADPDEQDVPELRELVAEALLREEVIELRIAAGRPADDDVVRAGHRLARVAKLAPGD